MNPSRLLKPVVVAGAAWLVQDQATRLLVPGGDHEPEAWAEAVWTAVLLLLLLALAGWGAWEARGKLVGAVLVSLALTAGLQLGRVASDALTGLRGELVSHDIWFGKPDYWALWSMGWPIFLALVGVPVLLLLAPARWAQRRWGRG